MKRPILLVLMTLGLVLGIDAPASAEPADWLCTPSTARGGVPATFLLEACADKTGVTVRNSLDVPVVVKVSGAVGAPAPVSSEGQDAGEIVRLLDVEGVVLVPGDVVRWPIGSKAAAFDVADLEPATAPAIVAVLDDYLPRQGAQRAPEEALQAFADVVPEIDDAVQKHTTCTDVDELNFLGAAGCDVVTATAIGHALAVRLTSGVAADLAPVVLDPQQWAEWAAVEVTKVDDIPDRTATLPQHAVPPAAPPPAGGPPAAPARVRPPGRPTSPPPPAPTPPAAPAPAVVPPSHGNGNGWGRDKGNGNDSHDIDQWIPLIEQWLQAQGGD